MDLQKTKKREADYLCRHSDYCADICRDADPGQSLVTRALTNLVWRAEEITVQWFKNAFCNDTGLSLKVTDVWYKTSGLRSIRS